jgi:hypothetical protein
MSFLGTVTSILQPLTSLGSSGDQSADCDDKQPNCAVSKHDDDDKRAKGDDHDDKQAKNDDHKDDCGQQTKNDGNGNDHGQYGSHNGNDNDHGQYASNDCPPSKDICPPTSPGDSGHGDSHGPGTDLSKIDFSHCDLSAHGGDHSGDMMGALASMSSEHALDYCIGQMGGADHCDAGHFDIPADTCHDMVHHA